MAIMCPFAAPSLSDPSRRRLYEILLEEKGLTVSQLARKLKLRQPTVSYHLKKMAQEGLVKAEKKGRKAYYRARKVCPEGRVCH